MSTRAPPACSVRAISAPIRRAPPVISTTWSLRQELSIAAAIGKQDTAMSSGRVLVRGDVAPSADERSHTLRMHEHLAYVIAAAGGWISFERYMDIALYAAGLGYYSRSEERRVGK